MKDKFLALVRIGIGHPCAFSYDGIDWDEVVALAAKQGLTAVIVDGIERLPEDKRPDKLVLLRMIGGVMQGYEQRYTLYRRAVGDLAAWYHAHGYRMMLLKGLACGLDWPKPEHRPYGDIDIYLYGQYKEADSALSCEFGVKIDKSHHHHTVFEWQGFTVENHYDFGNVHHHKSSRELETIFKELANIDPHVALDVASSDSGSGARMGGQGRNEVLPPATLHALFLLKHSMTDFAAFFVTIRQVLDWGFFVKAHGNEVDWEWLEGVAKRFHMLDFYNSLNAICVEDLGFRLVENLELSVESQLKSVEFRRLKEKVLNDILEPEFTRSVPPRLVPRLLYMFRRWKGNAWKHRMCYNESLWSGFWWGIWNHLMKPSL